MVRESRHLARIALRCCSLFCAGIPVAALAVCAAYGAGTIVSFLAGGLAVWLSGRILRGAPSAGGRHDEHERIELAFDAGRLGTWAADLLRSELIESANVGPMYGLPEGCGNRSIDEWLSRIHPDDRARIQAELKVAIQSDVPTQSEFRVVWPDGSIHWLALRGMVRKSLSLQPLRGFGIVWDITAEKAAEAALRESESRFRSLADAMPQIVWTARPDGVIEYFNKRWYEFTGFAEGTDSEASWQPVLHPDDLQRCIDMWLDAVRTQQPYEIEYRFLDRATGGYRWQLGRALPVRADDGTLVRWYGTCTDIDDLKRANEAVRHSEERYRSILLATSEIVWTTDADGSMVEGQPGWAGLTGQQAEEYSGRGWVDAIHPDDRKAMLDRFELAIRQHSACQCEHRVRLSGGTYRWFAMRAVPIPGADGSVREWVGAHSDINERKLSEQRALAEMSADLRESELRFRSVAESANDAIISADSKGTILSWNRSAERVFGYSEPEIIGRSLSLLIPGRLRTPDEDGLAALMSGGSQEHGTTVELVGLRKNGDEFPCELSLSAWSSDEGDFFTGIMRDITDRKRVEAELQEEAERRASIIETQELIARAGLDIGKVHTLITERAQRLTNADAAVIEIVEGDEMVYRAASGTAAPYIGVRLKREGSLTGLSVKTRQCQRCDDSENDPRVDREACRRVGVGSMIVAPLEHEGNVIGVLKVSSARAHAFTERDLQTLRLMVGFIAASMDQLRAFEERTRALALAKLSEERFRGLCACSPVGIFQADTTGRYLYTNPSWQNLSGRTLDESLEFEWTSAIHPDDRAAVMKNWQSAISRQTDFVMEFRFSRPDGTVRWVAARASPMIGERETILGYVGTTEDITGRKSVELELRSATEAKSQFLANMSHEIRSPLTSIIGYTEALLSEELSRDEQISALRIAHRNGTHLLGIINDILDLSKIEAGKLEVELLQVSLTEMMDDVWSVMKPRADEKGISFGVDYGYPVPASFRSDPVRLKQILFNLVGNAIKFTQQGGVKVRVSFNQASGRISLAVSDTGIGLTEEQRSRLFRAFSQGDTSTTRQFGGTGLGLVISQQLATKLGGEISVESVAGSGSTFTVTVATGKVAVDDLMYSAPTPRVPASKPAGAIPKLHGRVLLAEDGEDNQRFVSFLLKKTGLDITVVENGARALASALEDHFDLILMDMQMPVMDGYTAVRKLRQKGCAVPIVALTANSMTQDIQAALEAGCTRYLGKPFKRDELFSVLQALLEHSGEAAKEASVHPTLEEEDPELRRFAAEFVSNLPTRVAEFEASLENGSWTDLAKLAHALRGSAAFFPGLVPLTLGLEQAALKEDPASASAALKEVKALARSIERGKTEWWPPRTPSDS